MNWEAAAPLFRGWNKPMIFAALQGCMGRVVARGGEPPRSARLEVGDFAFFAGEPDRELAREALTFQQFYAPGGKLRLRLPPVSGMILI